jgi:hypothetical protein
MGLMDEIDILNEEQFEQWMESVGYRIGGRRLRIPGSVQGFARVVCDAEADAILGREHFFGRREFFAIRKGDLEEVVPKSVRNVAKRPNSMYSRIVFMPVEEANRLGMTLQLHLNFKPTDPMVVLNKGEEGGGDWRWSEIKDVRDWTSDLRVCFREGR